MEEEPSDPHEQQLYAVFKSCLAEGQHELDQNGLLALCSKLELEEYHKNIILDLLEVNVIQKSVSFSEFKDRFLQLLGRTEEGSEKERNGEMLSKNSTMCDQFSYPVADMKQLEAINCQQIQKADKLFDHQRLQETWSNHSSLTIEGVNSFRNKGSVLPKQTIELIFEKLDTDCDGLVNLEEFSRLFHNVSSKKQDQSHRNWSILLERGHTNADCCKDLVHQAGYIMRNIVIELWELAGISEANSLLLELGFEAPMVNVVELSNALSSELKLHRDVSHVGNTEYVRLLKSALVLSQEEVRNLNSTLEHLCCERDKLRTDIVEANERANILAQEVDEHQTRMDKARQEQLRQLELKHAETLKDLTNQFHQEREKSTSNLKNLEDQLQTSQQEEQRIRNELATVLKELRLLEGENQNQNDEITKLETCNSQLSMQVQELATAHAQVESIESKDNEQISDLMAHIKRLQDEMKILRDHNDELTSELEMLKNRENDTKSVVSSVDIRSTISDENDGVVSMPTTEVSDTEDEDKQQTNSKIHHASNMLRIKGHSDDISNGNNINRLSEIVQEFRNFLASAKLCAECSILRNEVSSLISELELYQSSLSAMTQPSSNKKKKYSKNLANELEAEFKSDEHSEFFIDLIKAAKQKRISSSDDAIHDTLGDNLNNSESKCLTRNKLSGLKNMQRKVSEKDNNANRMGTINNLDTKKQNTDVKDQLKEAEIKYAVEKKQLTDRVNELEKSLEMLRTEYEQCEEYWSTKLEEERQIFEQEQKISDEKFAELIEKMAEYEEQFNVNDKSDGRLSPIEEKVNLEQQYTDLEDEFEKWKIEAQDELERKEKEIDELKEKFGNKRKISQADCNIQCPDEDMKRMYPALYNELCLASSSAKSGMDKVDSSVLMGVKSDLTKQCLQCHKPLMQVQCDCQVNIHQQQNQNPKESKTRKDNEKKSKHRYYNRKKMELDNECKSLLKQRERLIQEINKLQGIKAMSANPTYPLIGTDERNIFANLYSRLHAHEQKQKYLQFVHQAQQKESHRAMHEMWRQHQNEVGNLRFIIKSTQDKYNQQLKINKDLNKKLTHADFLTKELYIENAKLTDTVKSLEQHCQILTQNRIESTSA